MAADLLSSTHLAEALNDPVVVLHSTVLATDENGAVRIDARDMKEAPVPQLDTERGHDFVVAEVQKMDVLVVVGLKCSSTHIDFDRAEDTCAEAARSAASCVRGHGKHVKQEGADYEQSDAGAASVPPREMVVARIVHLHAAAGVAEDRVGQEACHVSNKDFQRTSETVNDFGMGSGSRDDMAEPELVLAAAEAVELEPGQELSNPS